MMRTMKLMCGDCKGCGFNIVFVKVSESVIIPQEEACASCDGKGCFECVVFSPEEAKAILEHCGISVKEEA